MKWNEIYFLFFLSQTGILNNGFFSCISFSSLFWLCFILKCSVRAVMAWYTRLRRIKKSVVYDYPYFLVLLLLRLFWGCWLLLLLSVSLNNEFRFFFLKEKEKCVTDTVCTKKKKNKKNIRGRKRGELNLFAVRETCRVVESGCIGTLDF
jgi:hypothetical protein